MYKCVGVHGIKFDILDTEDNSVETVLPCVIFRVLDSGIVIEDLPDLSFLDRWCTGDTRKMRNGHYATCVYYRSYKSADFVFDTGEKREHVKWRTFSEGKLGLKSNDVKNAEFNIVGMRKQMKCGEYATCIAYRNNKDIDVKFDDGSIRYHELKSSFVHGDLTNLNSASRFSMKGVIIDMNCGQKATCIEDRGVYDIDIQFEDGVVTITSRSAFRKGSVTNPEIGRGAAVRRKYNFVGLEKYMNCGYKCKIIEYFDTKNITVQFEDGAIVKHRYKSEFDKGCILHPKLGRLWDDRDSIAQRLIFYYIKLYFSDAVYGLRPDWLKNYYTGCNFELDIYIPSIKVAIEFDGSVAGHFSKSRSKVEKFKLINSSENIDKIFVIRDDDDRIVTYDSPKYENIRLNYNGNDMRLPSIVETMELVLHKLGIDAELELNYDVIKILYDREAFKCLLKERMIKG